MKTNVVDLSVFRQTHPLDEQNRKRRARYEQKKNTLTITPGMFFKLEVIRHV